MTYSEIRLLNIELKKYDKIKDMPYILLHDTGVEANQEAKIIDDYHRSKGWDGKRES